MADIYQARMKANQSIQSIEKKNRMLSWEARVENSLRKILGSLDNLFACFLGLALFKAIPCVRSE